MCAKSNAGRATYTVVDFVNLKCILRSFPLQGWALFVKCTAKCQGGRISKMRDKAVAEYNPTFWECLTPVVFTHCKARGESCFKLRSQGVGGVQILQVYRPN